MSATPLAVALGVRQPKLDAHAMALFREINPWAFILFREACVDRAQVKALCAQLREAVDRDAVIWIDQEGGRVARLKPPEWPVWPAPAAYGRLYAKDAALGLEMTRLGYGLIAHELKSMGVDGDYAPVLDRPIPGSHDIVGDRAFAAEGDAIAALGRAALAGLHEGGVLGCIKHMPGHGRAEVDSHFSLPRVKAPAPELAYDVAPFKALRDVPAAMTAHIVYDAWDKDRPATCSPKVISEVIRGEIGFDGLLMSDDLDMKAMAVIGDLKARAEAALAAGCDVVLQCSGRLGDMEDVAQGCRPLEGLALVRARAAESFARRPIDADNIEARWKRFNELREAAGA